MDKLFNVEDGQIFEGVKHDLSKAQGVDFVPDTIQHSSQPILGVSEVKSLFEKAEKGTFVLNGKTLKVIDTNGFKTVYEQLNKALLPIARYSNFEEFSNACSLIKCAILGYPKDTISDALQKANTESHSLGVHQHLNDVFEDDVMDKAVVEKNNELIEKAKKGSPEYEEWLRKYREKRGSKSQEGESKEKARKVLQDDRPESDYSSSEVPKKYKVTKEQVMQKLADFGVDSSDQVRFEDNGKRLTAKIKGMSAELVVATTQRGLLDKPETYWGSIDDFKKEVELVKKNPIQQLRATLHQPNAYDITIGHRNGKTTATVSSRSNYGFGGSRFDVDVNEDGIITGISAKESAQRENRREAKRQQNERKEKAGGGFYVGGKKSTEAQYEDVKDQIAALGKLGVDTELVKKVTGFDNKDGEGSYWRTTYGSSVMGGVDIGFSSTYDKGERSWKPKMRDGKIRVNGSWVTPEELNTILKDSITSSKQNLQ